MSGEQVLAACPFCGSSNVRPDSHSEEHWIRCQVCGACSPTMFSAPDAVRTWNTRASPLAGGEVEVHSRETMDAVRVALEAATAVVGRNMEVMHGRAHKALGLLSAGGGAIPSPSNNKT